MIKLNTKKQKVKDSAEKEAERIFVKNYQAQYGKTGFPKINKNNINTPYANDYNKVQKKVVATRLKQYKANKKKK